MSINIGINGFGRIGRYVKVESFYLHLSLSNVYFDITPKLRTNKQHLRTYMLDDVTIHYNTDW